MCKKFRYSIYCYHSSPSNCGSLGANTYLPRKKIKVIVEPLDKRPHHSTLEVTPGLINSAPAGSTHHITVELTHHSAQLVCCLQKTTWHPSKLPLKFMRHKASQNPAKRLTSGFKCHDTEFQPGRPSQRGTDKYVK